MNRLLIFCSPSVILFSCHASINRIGDMTDVSSSDPLFDETSDSGDVIGEELEDTSYDPETDPPCIDPTCREIGIEVEASCIESGYSREVSPIIATPPLHIFAAYKAKETPDHTPGEVEVSIGCTSSPVVISLASHEPINWIISAEPEAIIERIYLTGFYEQTVSGITDVPIENIGHYHHNIFLWWSGGEEFAEELKTLTGLETTSFIGCHWPRDFSLVHVCE